MSSQYDDDLAELKVRLAAARPARSERFASAMDRARSSVPVNPDPVPGARGFMLSAVGPGWHLFTTGRHWQGEDMDQPGEAGTVIEVLHDAGVDVETGEKWERTRYRCLACWRPRPWSWLNASDVDVTRLPGVDVGSAAAAVRWLVRPVGQNPDHGLSRKERDRVIDAWRLVVALDRQ